MPAAKTERSPHGEIKQSQTSLGFLTKFLREIPTTPVHVHVNGRLTSRPTDFVTAVAILPEEDHSYSALVHEPGDLTRDPRLLGAIRFVSPEEDQVAAEHVETFYLVQVKNPTHIPGSDDMEKRLLHSEGTIKKALIPSKFRGRPDQAEAYRYQMDSQVMTRALKKGKLPDRDGVGTTLEVVDQAAILGLTERVQRVTGIPLLD